MATAFNGGTPDAATTTRALQYMVQQVGKPYIWGGNGPNGYDCSGIGYAGFRAVGARPNHRFTTFSLQSRGQSVPRGGPFLPGDAILTSPGHMIWCIGNGNAMEFARRGTRGRVTSISGRSIYMVRRIATPGSPINASADIVGPAPEGNEAWGGALDIIKLAEPLAAFFQAMADPRFWVRVGMFVGGVALLMAGVWLSVGTVFAKGVKKIL